MQIDAKAFALGNALRAYLAGRGAQENWETVFDGYVMPQWLSERYNGNIGWIYDYYGSPNRFNEGDLVRITLNGVVMYDTMQKDGSAISCGNDWLRDLTTSDQVDEGTDFFMVEADGQLRGFFRDGYVVYQLKLEKKSAVNKPLVMTNPHLYGGYKFPKIPERDETAYLYAMIMFMPNRTWWPVCVFSSAPLTSDYPRDEETALAKVLKFTSVC